MEVVRKPLFVIILLLAMSLAAAVAWFAKIQTPQASQQAEKLEERSPSQTPEDWKFHTIAGYAVSIAVPPNWYFTNPGKNYLANPDNSYLISDVPEVNRSYQDWALDEYVRLAVLFYNQGDLETIVHARTDYLDNGSVSGRKHPTAYTKQAYLINRHKAVRFFIDEKEAKRTSLRELLLFDIGNNRIMEVMASIREDIPEQQRQLYEDNVKKILDTLSIRD